MARARDSDADGEDQGGVRVRPAGPEDAEPWREMREALWPDAAEGEHREQVARFFAGRSREPLGVLIAEDPAGRSLGFAELSIRAYAEGCRTDRVAFLEGWFVIPEARGQGVGRALMAAAEGWGRGQGCTELGSDAEAENLASAAAHRALGFSEVGLVRCFRKDL